MTGFKMTRLGMLMEPERGNSQDVEGVLNPGAARGPDGELYLFPRLVAKGNYSRIGIGRVRFDAAGNPAGVERVGIALEPEADYERRPDGSGGCEDPRVTFLEPLGRYIMTYTALSPQGPRIALAESTDLFHWDRLGLARFDPYHQIDFVNVDNKDASVFPIAIPNHAGKMQMGLIHRPLFAGTRPEEKCKAQWRAVDIDRESIWISCCPMPERGPGVTQIGLFNSHYRVATPAWPWGKLKIGGGTPPVLTKNGWLMVYHGVSETEKDVESGRHRLTYAAGVMMLSQQDPRIILYRSPEPLLTPELPEEQIGTIGNVVFPTGIDRRDDIGETKRFDIYYGMADNRVGAARLDTPDVLPFGAN